MRIRWKGRSRIPEPDESRYLELRTEVYDEIFGECLGVHHLADGIVPHVDVHLFAPADDWPFQTLVTGGMSDIRMANRRRAELVAYSEEPQDAALAIRLRWLARLPHLAGFGVGAYETAAGDPPEPVEDGSELTAWFFLPPPVKRHELGPRLTLDGDPVELLWVVPISTAELRLKQEQGAQALVGRLAEAELPVTFDLSRRSVV